MNQNTNIGTGHSGLTNLGNTCYLNAAVQILSHIHELNHYLMNVKELNRTNDSVITIEWISLYKLMWSQNCIISPNRFVSKIKELSNLKTVKFCNFEQNDSNEYFYFMLDCIHNSLNQLDKTIILKKTNNDELNTYLITQFGKPTYSEKDKFLAWDNPNEIWSKIIYTYN